MAEATQLKSRHLTMMGLGSAVGAGLFLGVGLGIQISGTSVLISYAVAALNATVGTIRDVHEKVDAEDSASADSLNDYIRRFVQQAWFIRSQNGLA